MSLKTPWINVSECNNFCENDKYSDWRSALGEKSEKSEIIKLFLENSLVWEKKVVKHLEKITGKFFTKIDCSINFDIKADIKTLDAMRRLEPIIYKAYLSDKEEKFRGTSDLLIRNDYIEKLCPYISLDKEKSFLVNNYYYVPVSLKFLSLSNVNATNMKKYKIELFGFCKILYKIQGVLPKYSFIIGKKVEDRTDMEHIIKYPYLVNFTGKDNNIVTLFYKAIEWLRYVKTNCKNWVLCPDLYPNLKSKNNMTPEKLKIAEEVGEITEIFYCGYLNRLNAFNQGITSWKDPALNADILQVKDDQKERVNGILKINRGEFLDNNGLPVLYYPSQIKNNINNWKDNSVEEMYVDFETIRNSLDLESQDEDEFIFLIGVYYKGRYTSFIMEMLTLEEESICVKKFLKFWKDSGKPRIFYWYAEVSMWERCIKRHYGDLEITKWIDLYEIFYKEPFFVKGCKNFKLKSYIKALNNIDKIKVAVQSEECCNGLDAMVMAWKYYNRPSDNGPITRKKSLYEINTELKILIEYNKMDCIYLETLLKFIRSL